MCFSNIITWKKCGHFVVRREMCEDALARTPPQFCNTAFAPVSTDIDESNGVCPDRAKVTWFLTGNALKTADGREAPSWTWPTLRISLDSSTGHYEDERRRECVVPVGPGPNVRRGGRVDVVASGPSGATAIVATLRDCGKESSTRKHHALLSQGGETQLDRAGRMRSYLLFRWEKRKAWNKWSGQGVARLYAPERKMQAGADCYFWNTFPAFYLTYGLLRTLNRAELIHRKDFLSAPFNPVAAQPAAPVHLHWPH
ncbi:hypothetical protein CBER1_10012 [Cercospora berteroae]|uniref:Uncharacterized protein n=1 Tax=Cercospora berteroae TaxID=357750 RepID=A0A2S6CIG6_9PEZI|nr:hypothetical protein CBER1_10012 [Cercospora berteroae]